MSLSMSSTIAQEFPKDWVGNYKGEMLIGFADQPGDTLEVDFLLEEVIEDSAWTYRMTYRSDKYGDIVKDYIIRKTGDTKSAYVLDELDGILIEMTLMDNCFYSSFSVLDNMYMTMLYKLGDNLFFDLVVVSNRPTKESVSEEDEEGQSFEVSSYKPTLHQSAYFIRQ